MPVNQALRLAADPIAKPMRRRARRTVLVIEADALVRRFLVRSLEEDGYAVVALADREQALDWLRSCLFERGTEGGPALILSDVALPRQPGPGLAQRLVDAVARIPLISIASSPSEESYEEAFGGGAAHVLTVPFDRPTLLLAVRNVLEARPPPPSISRRRRTAHRTSHPD